MPLDTDAVAHIARLARIRLAEAELEPLAAELSAIIGWVEQLGEIDTANVAPMTHAQTGGLPMREDQVSDGGSPDAILANAPRAARGFFAVPKVIE